MESRRRGRRAGGGVLACFLLVLPACERGCVWTALREHGAGEDPSAPGASYFGLQEIDCPDGLSRCAGGVVETSLAARRPSPCKGNPEACACPWTIVDRCPSPCVAEGLQVNVQGSVAVVQLCKPASLDPAFARPATIPAALTLAEQGACDGEAFACVASHVVACNPGRAVGTCVRGCASAAPGGSSELTLGGGGADSLTDAQALALLCLR